jgi:hypothetical protein
MKKTNTKNKIILQTRHILSYGMIRHGHVSCTKRRRMHTGFGGETQRKEITLKTEVEEK